jgi:hypothetical protein
MVRLNEKPESKYRYSKKKKKKKKKKIFLIKKNSVGKIKANANI